ncbi:MAG: porin [Polaromonas sp.]|nr:porin [Polaromonas sp.]
MKKSLIALAVLATSGAAMAQSSVTLYGWIDTYLANTTVDNGVTSTSTSSMNSGAINGNRWGLKGSEDLGGGLKANFQLEQGFNIDTGAAASALQFHRQAWVGLSGGFGAVKIGRVYTAYDDVNGFGKAVFDSAFGATVNVYKSGGYTPRIDNGFRYESPTMSGFDVALSANMSEGTATAVTAQAIKVAYSAGPLSAAFGYQTEGSGTTVADKKFTRLGAAYNMGALTVKGSLGQAANMGNVDGADASEYTIGADYSVSSAMTVSAGYAHSDDNAKAGDATRSGFAVGAKYTLSKRTFVYGGYNTATTEMAATPDAKTSMFAVGINHNF